MEKLIELYKQWKGEEPANVVKLAGQGSNRQYFRITQQKINFCLFRNQFRPGMILCSALFIEKYTFSQADHGFILFAAASVDPCQSLPGKKIGRVRGR